MPDKKFPVPPKPPSTQDVKKTEPRGEFARRLGKIVHDHRGNASVEWVEAPADYKRPVFEIEGGQQAASPEKKPSGFNPYEHSVVNRNLDGQAKPAKRDLRKLSEWIKLMREIEERKSRGEE